MFHLLIFFPAVCEFIAKIVQAVQIVRPVIKLSTVGTAEVKKKLFVSMEFENPEHFILGLNVFDSAIAW